MTNISSLRTQSTPYKIGTGFAAATALGAAGALLGHFAKAKHPLLTAGIGAAIGGVIAGALLLGGNSSSPLNSQGDFDCGVGGCL